MSEGFCEEKTCRQPGVGFVERSGVSWWACERHGASGAHPSGSLYPKPRPIDYEVLADLLAASRRQRRVRRLGRFSWFIGPMQRCFRFLGKHGTLQASWTPPRIEEETDE